MQPSPRLYEGLRVCPKKKKKMRGTNTEVSIHHRSSITIDHQSPHIIQLLSVSPALQKDNLQTKDRMSTRVAHLGKRDESARVEFIALVHVDTSQCSLDISHGWDAVE